MYNIIGSIGRHVAVNVGVSVIMYGLTKGTYFTVNKVKKIKNQKVEKAEHIKNDSKIQVNDRDIGDVTLFKEKLKYAEIV